MPGFVKNNGLTIVLFFLFLFSISGQSLTGWQEYNSEQRDHNQPEIAYTEYLATGHFIEAVFENWESEFLQMAAYILLTVFLFQKGSSESKEPGRIESVNVIARKSPQKKKAPWPVKYKGWVLRLYENSLSLAFILLFLFSFALHAAGGAEAYNNEQQIHGGEAVSVLTYVGTARFWFESFQNWQSEFFSIGLMVLLSIWLRQKGSPESKPVDSPHSDTGKG